MSEKFDDFSSFRSKSMEKKKKKNEAYVDFKKNVLHEKHMKPYPHNSHTESISFFVLPNMTENTYTTSNSYPCLFYLS